MPLVKIIAGAYGLPTGGLIVRKDRRSGAFEVPQAEAERIIGLGIAAYADISADDTDSSGDFGETPRKSNAVRGVEPSGNNYTPEGKYPSQGENEGDFGERPDFDENSSATFLRALGKKLGLKFAVGVTKAEMVAQLNRFYADEDPERPAHNGDEPSSEVEELI